ncbi:MAG TPA: aminoacyl-tRNA hydrolase [Planctomycetaceae bacterium]|nr:aminoacyl-tRNA hydrolase [Planctomycetaceae bacterium]HIQ20856.1 aminoacyl-tRNA hydrolase [Planctomycetota bacterium]
MKLVVGLGNPGRKYEGTRHNVGYLVLAELARRFGTSKPRSRFHGHVVEVDLEGVRAVLLSPLTYMNRSGLSAAAARDYYKLANDDLLVICDDLNLPLGKLRVRPKGSSGGQKGLEDIIRHLGAEDFPRLRIGIGSPPQGWDATDYVLGRFSREEKAQIEQAVRRASDAVVAWARHGIQHCMNQYNTPVQHNTIARDRNNSA